MNFLKLKIVLILFEGGKLKYGKGDQDTYLGQMNLADGLMMMGIPLLVGHEPKDCLRKFESKLNRILKAAWRTQPTYVLALMIILSFAVASPDYVFTVIPAKREWTAKHQILIKKVVCAVLCIQKNVPNTWLYMPLSLGGFGIVEIETRFQLKCIAMWVSALKCRNALTKQATRYAWFTDIANTLRAWDPRLIREWLRYHKLNIVVSDVEQGAVQWSEPQIEIRRKKARGTIYMIFDGSKGTIDGIEVIGWAAVIGDNDGLLATAHQGIQSDARSSWAAEWCGKGECMDLLEHINWEDCTIGAMVADNVSATFGEVGGRPSPCAWIDRIRLKYAEFVSRHDVPEYFMPAPHDTGDNQWLARWQSIADELAKAALQTARGMSAPFRRHLEGMALLFKSGTLVVHVTKGLDQCAVDQCMPVVSRTARLVGRT